MTLGFIWGSITDPRPGTRWPEYVIGWFVGNYPEVRFTVENAAIGATGRDLVLTYTYIQGMYDDMMNGKVPCSISEFETLAEHYGIGSVWMGFHALQEVKRGKHSMEIEVIHGNREECMGTNFRLAFIGILD